MHRTPEATTIPAAAAPISLSTTTVDIVVPVYNEERALTGTVEVLRAYLRENFPYDWTITVMDNGSEDGTLEVANALARNDERVRVMHLDVAGRGRALREAWGRSGADVVVYMDADLSTGLDALLPLVAPLANGHSDIAIGSRHAPGARTIRGLQREFISRSYNALIRLTHGARFRDAQCGFKAARGEVIRPLLHHVHDDGWFFDTELLLLAEHNGLRVHEVPVDWIEDVDTRVEVTSTAWHDIRGLIRVARAKARGTARVDELPRRPDPKPIHPDPVLGGNAGALSWQLLSFAIVGAISTVATLTLYAIFREWMPLLLANLAALTLTTLFNTEANRRYTFAGRRHSTGRVHFQGIIVFALYYGFTSGALLLLHWLAPDASRLLELTVLLVSSILGTTGRFLLLRNWVFRRKEPTA
ncbi:bifunctional glycosyltransferase family 2/GtrA family protein [Amycolatopsis sp. 195334CR]|uniref:bifunctional glycosyltransferase family 2/GtrA family protein n=1 Tax=Amycolatopsis sp. 195334CR TaxID=2814588 RepID=UPI001A9047B5|nr:bifunctional glycosyltransferase family 2/GtrA family protein [Amycolatopsis sp. 195334CR]MBN6033891.1 bifunctional glycosyltransferase family 2/GtrA family protein [Amycolatopsis sp. 195334CR]